MLETSNHFTPMFWVVYWNQPVYPSVHVSVLVSVCVQNTSTFMVQSCPTVLLPLY